MAKTILNVPDISCAHCVRTITGALSPVEGVQSVTVSIQNKQVSVDYDPNKVDVEQMKHVLEQEDYPVASVEATGQESAPSIHNGALVQDPVCGMSVNPLMARHRSEYQGTMYFFCSPGCKQAFETNPQQYLSGSTTGSTAASCACCSAMA